MLASAYTGLNYLHGCGYIHANVTPSAVVVLSSGRICIVSIGGVGRFRVSNYFKRQSDVFFRIFSPRTCDYDSNIEPRRANHDDKHILIPFYEALALET